MSITSPSPLTKISSLRAKLVRILSASLLLSLLPLTASTTLPVANATPTTTTAGYDFSSTISPNGFPDKYFLYLTSPSNGSATITYGDSTSSNITLVAGVVTQETVSSTNIISAGNQGSVANKVIKIHSTVPTTVYACAYAQYTSDCTNIMPEAVWGTRYRALAYSSAARITVNTGASAASVSFTFKSSVNTGVGTFNAGDSTTVSLAPYTVYTFTASSGDLNGTLITSTAGIGVLSSNDCSQAFGFGACDVILEQVAPVDTWGKNFFINGYQDPTRGSGIGLVADQDGTTINITGSTSQTINLNAGDSWLGRPFSAGGNQSLKITSNKPILLAHFMNGGGAYNSGSGPTTGDPSLSYMPPYEQYLSSYTFVNASNFIAQFVNVIIPRSALASLRLDNAVVNTSGFANIVDTSTGWVSGILNVTTGTHRLKANQPFGIEVYGANNYNSYAYVGGASFVDLATISTLETSVATVVAHQGSQACISVTVKNNSATPVAGARVDATIVGVNAGATPFGYTDENGVAQVCYTTSGQGTDVVTLTVNGINVDVTVNWGPPDPNAPIWVTTDLGAIDTSTANNIALTVNNSPTQFQITDGSLPPGLDIDSVTGTITGTATGSGSYSVEITAFNSYGSAAQVFSGTVGGSSGGGGGGGGGGQQTPPAPPKPYTGPVWTQQQTLTVYKGEPFSQQLSATKNPRYGQSSPFPIGVTINQSTGIIGGTPNANGTYTVLVAAANDDGIAFMQFQIIVIDRPATATNTGSSGSSNSDEPNLDPRTPVSGNILVNEQAAKLQIIPNNSANGLTVDVTGWSLDLVGKGIDGNPTKLSPKSEIIVVPGQGVATTGTGFKPNSPVKVYIFSSPTLLGTLTTDANGKFTSTLPLPKDLAVGTHQIQVNGISPENLVRSATVPALVEDTSATKSTTGSTTAAIASKQAVIPFGFNLFQIGSTQLKAIQALSIPKKGKLLINGYAQPTSGQDDIRISLDRAIEVKKYLAKVLPNVTIEVMGLGTKRQSLCSTYKNKCAIVKVVA